MRPAIKFCGLTRPGDAAHGITLGAAYLGVIFAGGPRRLEPRDARQVVEPAAGTGVRRVGVFGQHSPDEIARIADEVGLDVVQLHADPTPARVQAIGRITGREIWAVARIGGGEVPSGVAALFACADGVLLDTLSRAADGLGGTGRSFDWTAARTGLTPARAGRMLIVAGGLTPLNVAAAIGALAPDVVDVSSGVESAVGEKDHALMAAFAAAVNHLAPDE